MTSATEQWRQVPGWPQYEVSPAGLVRRAVRGGSPIAKRGRLLTPHGSRYLHVTLHADGRHGTYSVHRLVARAYLGEPPSPRHEVAHGDGNPRNNAVGNLRWALRTENAADRVIHGTTLRGERSPNCRVADEQVQAIRRAAARGLPHDLIAAIAGISPTQVGRICRGERR